MESAKKRTTVEWRQGDRDKIGILLYIGRRKKSSSHNQKKSKKTTRKRAQVHLD